MQDIQTDVLIIGSGLAGLSLALYLANQKVKVCLLSKQDITASSSYYAQGGIAAVKGGLHDAAIQTHIMDTLMTGGGLSDKDVVTRCVKQAWEFITDLSSYGVAFNRDGANEYHFTQEGGHSRRRILHVNDKTGQIIVKTLYHHLLKNKYISFLSQHMAIDLITYMDEDKKKCCGVYVLDLSSNKVRTICAKQSVLATGGASNAYLYTTNPNTSSGDGIAMAWRAGCSISNMEFNQFHPTSLYHMQENSFLISEALRGEGARLILKNGASFMHDFDKRAELAPRDIVARAIDYQMKHLGDDYVYLDISHKSASFIQQRFPTIYAKCLALGIDISRDPIPVVPAAHYTCGGVVAALDGSTEITGLYVIGESACSGLHGANRLASNSILECGVMAKNTFNNIMGKLIAPDFYTDIRSWDASRVDLAREQVLITHNWHEVRSLMWDYVGIVRSNKRLEQAKNRVAVLQREVQDFYASHTINADLLELRNLVCVSDLIIESAIKRKESRGLHYNIDYPYALKDAKNTYLNISNTV